MEGSEESVWSPVVQEFIKPKFKLRIVPPAKANEPYSDAEVELMLSMVPSHHAVGLLAQTLCRSRGAIMMIYQLAYSGNWLKQQIAGNDGCPDRDNVHLKIGRAKKKLGIFVGHRPK